MLDSGIDIPSSVQATDMVSSPPPYPAVTSSPGLVSEGPAGYRAGPADSSPSPVPSSDELMPQCPDAVTPADSSLSRGSTASAVSFDRGFLTEISVRDRFEF
jgi:hypothetical protein